MRRALPILIVLVGLVALVVDFVPGLTLPFGGPDGSPRTVETKLGLDLEGGLRVVYQAQPVEGKAPTQADMAVIRDIMEQRVNAVGVAEPVVQTQGADRIVVELPGVDNPQVVRDLVGQTGRVEFVPIPPGSQVAQGQAIDLEQYPPLFSGDQVSSAAASTDQFGGLAVAFTLKSEGAALFADYTSNNVGNQFAIVLDGTIVSAPVIQSPITSGEGQITAGGAGGFSADEANGLITVLRYGSLPFPVQEAAYETIAPTLGDAFLQQGVLAALVGILLVALLMVLHYRLPGLVAVGALAYYTILVLAIFRIIPVTLTLAGIAGFVLSVGMAVDANILIFERMKEELRAGKSLAAATEAGFNRAWNSIFDSNVSSLITATILFTVGTSVIRGFALVLIIGVLISMFTAITVSRTVLRWVVSRRTFQKASYYGVSDEEFVARPTARPTRRGEATGRV
jgi:preprotein translocase subunit SecD